MKAPGILGSARSPFLAVAALLLTALNSQVWARGLAVFDQQQAGAVIRHPTAGPSTLDLWITRSPVIVRGIVGSGTLASIPSTISGIPPTVVRRYSFDINELLKGDGS